MICCGLEVGQEAEGGMLGEEQHPKLDPGGFMGRHSMRLRTTAPALRALGVGQMILGPLQALTFCSQVPDLMSLGNAGQLEQRVWGSGMEAGGAWEGQQQASSG